MDFVDEVECVYACGVDIGSTCGIEGGVVVDVEGMGGRLRDYYGLGLGVFLCDDIVVAMGGSQRMKDDLARGTYTVWLLATQPEEDDARFSGSTSVSSPSGDGIFGPTVYDIA